MIFYDPVFYVLSGLFLYFITAGALVPWAAQQKGRSGFAWMLIAFVWTPLFALIALAAVPVKPAEDEQPEVLDTPEFKWRKP